MLVQPLQHCLNMQWVLIRVLEEVQNVMQVGNNELVQEVPQYIINEVLECS